ncbi:acyl-CoA dehydrogenase family protein [Paeniglutamicibacter gangotriensis]|uniref:Acyl-CoA dehydrogenase n=1 Tax=Paeniglutamicibacter gangotriensis Lz1y TaxID=1276920 RepID=M7MVU4_9MICC|nr:acyl-CoA dehydrogenase family protein [Paeniglutamicibacter gangotriensis]EMR00563.1 acyl-CoA dehydrogenase [Paeniglutamicibacter gangotriensis Lz1y]
MSTTTLNQSRLTRLSARFAPVFATIAAGAAARDADRSLPYQEIRELAASGFGALRVPESHGGAGATLSELFSLLTDLAAADPNLTQALRAHFAFVEDRLVAAEGPERERWLERFAAGELVGNSWTEIGTVALGEVNTKVNPDSQGGFTVTGTKYYSTGSIFADWIDTYAERSDSGKRVIAVVNAHQPGVQLGDDWDGFGQRTTGTGTSTFTAAVVEETNIIDFDTRFRYQTAFYQVVLLVVLAGSAQGGAQDFAAELAARKRTFSHGAAAVASEDPQLLQVIGEVSAAAFVAKSTVIAAAQGLEAAYQSALGLRRGEIDLEADIAANDAAELASAQGQVALTPLVTTALSRAFDALAASATITSKNLDRHWRNARTAGNHNPWVFKARLVGEHAVHGRELPRVWAIGASGGK